MDSDQYRTPQKIFTRRQSPTNTKYFNINSQNLGTPKLNNIHPGTPASINKRSTFNVFPFIKTPSTPVRFPKVINPFEHALTERLHLPLICSPSLFQPANTPQHSSTQFEWTIEEVSSLGPVNVIPDITQFQATPDPDLEAKAQAAISSFFLEHQIVPSPIDCPLRYQKIILSDATEGSSGGMKPVRRIRDGMAQTILSFPPNLPPEMENILKQFYTFNETQQQSPTVVNNCDTIIDYEAADASLRRKQLFKASSDHGDNDIDDEVIKDFTEIDGLSPPPKSPDLETFQLPIHNSGSSIKNTSFGLLSPISKLDSPKKLRKLNDIKINRSSLSLNRTDCNETEEGLYRNLKSDKSLLRASSSNSLYGSTPDIFSDKRQNSIADMSVDISCFNAGVDRLNINNTTKQLSQNAIIKSKSFSDMDNIFNTPATDENNSDYDDEMQISQSSSKSTSSSSSSQHPDTPVRKRRSANRKNLSRSFSYHQTDDDDDDDENFSIIGSSLQLKITAPAKINENNIQQIKQEQNLIMDDPGKSIFGRTDSGFTEISNIQDESKINDKRSIKIESDYSDLVDVSIIANDVSMVCCSTPSTK